MKPLLNEEQLANFFVKHLSPSAIRQYLTDRQGFFKKYVRLEFDDQSSPALIKGNLVHAYLEKYYNLVKDGKEFPTKESLIESVIKEFNEEKRFDNVNWGKTGSCEKTLKEVNQAIDFYINELPSYGKILAVEEKFVTEFEDLDGNMMPIPLKGFMDLVTMDEDGNIIIVDHKTVTSPKKQEDLCPAYEIQACAYWFGARIKYGVNPTKMIFAQIKSSKNRDGSPQITNYEIVYDRSMLLRFLELYRRIIMELSGQPLIDPMSGIIQFLPNPFAMFGWEDSWNDFCEEVDDGNLFTFDDARVIREEKTEDVEPLDL